MALVGGGGAGNVAGSNPAGIGARLNFIGNHCYAYSGEVSVGASLIEMLSFSTAANQYIVAEIQISSDAASGTDFYTEMKLNGEIIFSSFMNDDTTPYPTGPQPINVLIPANSSFSFALKSDAGARVWNVGLVGRVYA